MISIFIICLFLFILLFLAYFLIGSAIPKSFFSSNLSIDLQRVTIGYALFVILQGVSFVYGYANLIVLLVITLSLIGAYKLLKYSEKTILKLDLFSLVIPLSFLLIVFTPFLFGAIFFGNIDPGDLHGYAVGYLKEGGWSKLYQSWNQLGTETSPWQSSGEQYSFSDYRLAVAFDYLVFSIRWGMPVIANWINQNFNQEIYIGILVASAIPLFISPLILYDFFKRKFDLQLSSTALFLTFLSFGVSTPVLLWHEGLLNHIAVLPIFILMLLAIDDILGNPSVKKIVIFSLLYIASITIWSEASILIIIYAAAYCGLSLIEIQTASDRKSYLNRICFILSLVALFSFLIFPEALMDFIYLCLNRVKHHYPPGILAFDWSLLDIALPFPVVWVNKNASSNIQLLFHFSKYQRIIEASILLAISFFIYLKDKSFKGLLVSTMIIFVFSLLNKPYIYWNVVTLLMPLIVLGMYSMLRNRFNETYLKKSFVLLSLLGICFMQFLQYQYSGISQSIKPYQFNLDDTALKGEKRIAILTPTLKNGYLRYGWNHNFHWVNKTVSWFGQVVKFRNNDQSLLIAYYFDCEVEGYETCGVIKKNTGLRDKKLYLSNIKVSDICDENGNISDEKILKIKNNFFGQGIKYE